jgi:hypothetical protein
LDLIYFENRIGGLERAAEIISELELDFSKAGDRLLECFPSPVIQRLGYVLENVIGDKERGTEVYARAQDAGIGFRKTLLGPREKISAGEYKENTKWKLIINSELEGVT